MRLNRGSGVLGLAGIRPSSHFPVPGPDGQTRNALLLRPLLTWRHALLAEICSDAGLQPVADPSNEDEQFERVRIRKALAASDWLNPQGIAWSAAHLNAADAALHWATDKEWDSQVTAGKDQIAYRPAAPFEIRRRVVRRAVAALATEGAANPLRGPELDRLVAALSGGGKATLRGVLCTGGPEWRFAPAPPRS
jgi:tRNA(Ile)-lysidine synthase